MRLTRSKAIKAHCFECSGWNRAEVRKCAIRTCPLYPFRTGTVKRDKSSDSGTGADGQGKKTHAGTPV
jgi:hypothetical protein